MVDEREAYLSVVKSNCSRSLTVTGNKKEGGKNKHKRKLYSGRVLQASEYNLDSCWDIFINSSAV